MSIYITTTNRVIGVNEDQVVPADAVAVPDTFNSSQYPFLTLVNGVVVYTPPPITVDQQIVLNMTAMQKQLDVVAKQYGYDDIKTAIGWGSDTPYVQLSTNSADENALLANEEKYRLEGNAFKLWRSQCYAFVIAYNDGMKAGTNPVIDALTVISKLPQFVAPV